MKRASHFEELRDFHVEREERIGYDDSPKAEGKGRMAMALHDKRHGSPVGFARILSLRAVGGFLSWSARRHRHEAG